MPRRLSNNMLDTTNNRMIALCALTSDEAHI